MDGEGQLLHLAKELKELFKCAKCEKDLEPPMSHCISGHDICSHCKDSSCPLCSAGFAVSSKLMEQVFKLHPKPCKYSDRGCSHVSVTGRHEPICEFRTIKCRVGQDNSCTWCGTVKDWMEHVHSKHSRAIAYRSSEKHNGVEMDVDNLQNLPWNNNCFYLTLDNKVFLFFMLKTSGEIYYAVRYVPVESSKDEYLLKVSWFQSSTFYHICAVKVTVLAESELLEDICESYGVFIDELKIHVNRKTVKFELKKRNLN